MGAGGDTGAALFGQSLWTENSDTKGRVYTAQYSFQHAAHVHNVANVFHVDNAFWDGYICGWGTIPYKVGENVPIAENPRTMFHDDNRPSVWVSLERYEPEEYGDALSLTGFLGDACGREELQCADAQKVGFGNAYYLNKVHGFRQHHVQMLTSTTDSGLQSDFQPGHSTTLCWPEMTGSWNPSTQCYDRYCNANGFFPNDMYGKGFRDALNGNLAQIKRHDNKIYEMAKARVYRAS